MSARQGFAAICARRRSRLTGCCALAGVTIVLPGLVSGCGLSTRLLAARNLGTIVVEVTRMTSTDVFSGQGAPRQTTKQTVTSTSITETSATGTSQRDFISDSFMRPGYQEVDAGDSIQLYDPTDNTIYETTLRAWQAAVTRQMDRNEPKGAQSSSHGLEFVFSFSPGRLSVFEQQLHAGLYKLAGRTRIAGRTVLKLVPTHGSVRLNQHSGVHEVLGTVYIAPRTGYPVKEIIRPPSGTGISSTLVETWLTYKVLPATAANRELVSLTARHPTARVVDGATAFVRAQRAQTRR